MDSSPLVKVICTTAHDHARAAALAHTDTTVAINEHALAAGEFSNAAQTTASTEALRTLKLLEQHHRRLSELLKFPGPDYRVASSGLEHEIHEGSTAETRASSSATTHPEGGKLKRDGAVVVGAPRHAAQAGSSQQRRYPPSRELSSSIASNVASARGIRSKYRGQRLAPSVSNDQAPGSLDGLAHKDGTRTKMQNILDQKSKPSWVPPAQAPPRSERGEIEQKAERTGDSTPSSNDDGYSRFYSTFGSLINRLSAPLAFAGLPLIAEESTSEPAPATAPEPASPQRKHRGPRSHVLSPEPELSKIFSKATLRSLGRDGHGANDSFYFVPTTGGTVSYANILSFDQKEKRRLAASVHGDNTDALDDVDEDDFVDARESQSSLSPGMKKRLGKGQTPRDLQNAVEELYLENKSLKDMLDKLSKRLHAFEANAQNSHLALQSSMRFMCPGSPLSLSGSGGKKDGGDDTLLKKRNRELEEELAATLKQMHALEKEYNRSQKTIAKYRDMWEKLKAGAKARREAQGSGLECAESTRTPAP